MKLWDTHAHLYMLPDPDAIISSLGSHHIAGCICPAIDYNSSLASIALAKQYPGIVGGCVGLHPNESCSPWDGFIQLAQSPYVWAIGETGLDYYRDIISPEIQQQRFIAHILLAKQLTLPLIVHVRHAAEDVLAIIKNYAKDQCIILHSFTETTDIAHRALDLGCYISFSGIVTFKNAPYLRDTLKTLPLDTVLIETDSPYLSPEPFRGRSNEPKHVIEIAKTMAHTHNISLESITEQLLKNTKYVFTKIPL